MNKSRFSINQLNGDKYLIPDSLDDKNQIDSFLDGHKEKKVVVVQGLGFVGAVMSLVCANAISENYAVIGVDLANEDNFWKIKSLNNGLFPIIASDPQIQKFFEESIKKKNFLATYDSYAYSKADFIIVDINLDVQKETKFDGDLINYDVDLNNFKNGIRAIGDNCNEDVLVLVETTVPPGTCKKVVKPIIDMCLTERNLSSEKYKLGHSYERVMPGPDYIDSIQNFYRVFSGIDDRSAKATELFLKTIISTKKYPLTKLGSTNATELAKVLENSYRAMNIAFATEWSRFAEESEVNLYEVVDAIRMRPTHSNLMYPGIGVGGYCLTKDPLLASWAKQNHFNSSSPLIQSENGVKINDKMPLFAFEFMKRAFNLLDLKNKKLTFLGVSYRSNVADTRYSPVERFYNFCLKDGAEISLHDPYVSFWEELNLTVSQDLFSILNNDMKILIISTSHDEYKSSNTLINKLLAKDKMMIYDTVGLFSENEITILLSKHDVKVLGRGDL
jgi:UDP-N-acetyl-D-glucosamine dehydrogenase